MNKNLPIKIYDSFVKICLSSFITICFGILVTLLAFASDSFTFFPLVLGISFCFLGIWAIIFSFRRRKTPMLIIDHKGLSGTLVQKSTKSSMIDLDTILWSEIKNLRYEHIYARGARIYYLYVDLINPEKFYKKIKNKHSYLLLSLQFIRKRLFKIDKSTLFILPINNIKERELVFKQIVDTWTYNRSKKE